MTSDMWIGLVLGAFLGFWVGRFWAEFRRALHDMRRVWKHRRSYRK